MGPAQDKPLELDRGFFFPRTPFQGAGIPASGRFFLAPPAAKPENDSVDGLMWEVLEGSPIDSNAHVSESLLNAEDGSIPEVSMGGLVYGGLRYTTDAPEIDDPEAGDPSQVSGDLLLETPEDDGAPSPEGDADNRLVLSPVSPIFEAGE